ncbi:hypothetical protein ACLI4Z_05840 [Natrialbaceae archaeon A-arb3/5]
MSDDRPRNADAADAADEDGPPDPDSEYEPGGGPRRVVSDQSVDDILASLDETAPADETGTESAATTTAERTPTDADGDDTGDASTADESESPTAASDDRPEADDQPTASFDEDDLLERTGEETSGDDPDSGPAAATEPNTESATPVDSAADELEARIERGDVTGADVRAAEAGEGRESTPAVDEIELSMDDIENTAAGGPGEAVSGGTDGAEDSSETPAVHDGAGSLATDTTADESEAEDASGAENESGLLGRIKRLFSG